MVVTGLVPQSVAAAGAGVAGGVLAQQLWLSIAERRRKERLRAASGVSSAKASDIGRALALVLERSRSGSRTSFPGLKKATRVAEWWLSSRKACFGVGADVTAEGFARASVQLGAVGCAIGAAVGAVVSAELCALLAIIGGGLGLTACARDVRALAQRRAAGLDRSLSEMLEVMALGLRSGMSFDGSFSLYPESFSSVLAQECGAAYRDWQLGLSSREEALRALSSSYDSALLNRAVEGMIRSVRFGSGLADVLDSTAAQARAERRARIEEQVAKAPVKMMIPTGVLILPAMLLLVLGPVLLELVEGW